MPIKISITETDFFLPEDGTEAEKEFLSLLNNPGETWICAFGFTLQPMFDEIKKADAAGIKIHILLDHSQEGGTTEKPKVQDLVNSMKNGDVTITTAGVNSLKKSQIWHWKGLVVSPVQLPVNNQNGQTFCWEGSTNFSESAWFQGNSARIFQSSLWASVFIKQFEAHKAWALENEAQYQLKPGTVISVPAKKIKAKKG